MYRVEMIPKKSVMDNIIDYWKLTGREDNCEDGQFVFDSVVSARVYSETLQIDNDAKTYIYNVSDFYRIKIIALD